MKFLHWFTYLMFLAFVNGLLDAAMEGTRWQLKGPTPHFFTVLAALWLLIAAVREVSLKVEAIAEKLMTQKFETQGDDDDDEMPTLPADVPAAPR